MDPYRPPFGYRPPPFGAPPPGYGPPPAMPGYGPGAPVGYMPGRPPMHHGMHQPPPMAQAPPEANNEADKLTTLFVGAIAPGIPDDWMLQLLQACGPVKNWKRMKDPSGQPKGFGFVEYQDPPSVLRALKWLGGEQGTHDGIQLTAADGSQVQKKLIVKADDNVRNHLEQYQASNTNQSEEDESSYSLEKVQKIVNAINNGLDPSNEPEDTKTGEETTEADHDTTTDQNDFISKELAFFRERAAQRDHERQEDEQDRQRHARGSDAEQGRRGGRRKPLPRQEFVRGLDNEMPEDHEDLDDEELERLREEKHERDVQAAFRQREKRLESREATRLRDFERDQQRLEEEDERIKKNREVWAHRLATWDDEVEMEREEFYTNRSRWQKRREVIRRREEEQDEDDRRNEAYEIEERRRAQERERAQDTTVGSGGTEERSKIALKPTKLNFNVPIKRVSAMAGNEDDDDDEESGRKRRVLVPLDYGDVTMDDASYMDQEERVKKVKELIDSIPSSKDELWQWTVKWNQLDEELLMTKLKAFVSKKVVELVGAEEEALVNFILDAIRKHQEPESLVQELEKTLDEEALIFVMKLWRTLIFETERKSRRL